MNVANILWDGAGQFEGRPILYMEDRAITFLQLAADVGAAAGMLKAHGVTRGDRVALLANNSAEWFGIMFATASLGAVCVPINPALTSAEVCNIVDHCEPKVAVVDDALKDLLAPAEAPVRIVSIPAGDLACEWRELAGSNTPHGSVEDMDPADPAIIFYTSGTTGQPKGVVLAHSAVMFIADMFSRHSLISPSDTSLVMGSVAFIYPLLINALASIRGGATVVLQDRFHPEQVTRIVERRRVSILMGVPTMYTMIANWAAGKKHDYSSIRVAFSAGASFPASLAERVHKGLGFHVFDLWGMTECTPVSSFDPARDRAGRPDSAGRALPDCAFRVVDDELNELPAGEVGEILLTSPARMTGYYKNPSATTEALVDGWVRSGDLGRVDEDGFLYIVGRKKDLIIRGGANVYPVDVEEVLFAHPAVAECAVVGIPDATYGETVKAFVVLKEDAEVDADVLMTHCRGMLAEYKVPSSITFVEMLPKGPTGKILRRELRQPEAVGHG
jgi:long-chain acyl-CoA synthetase